MYKKPESGQSLFEVLLALAVFVIAIATIAHLFLAAHYSAAHSVEKSQAVLLVKEGLEAVRSIRDAGFGNIEAKEDAGIVLTDNKWAFQGTPDITDNKFTRKINITSVDDNTWQVESTVEWTSITGKAADVSLTERLTAWRLPRWLLGWDYRRPITVDNTENSNSLTNYQVKVDIAYDSDMSSSDFSDLRFTDSDGITELSYWIEGYTIESSATVWVKVPSISASSQETIFMYYGNSSASSQSDGDNTFFHFDSYDTQDTSYWTFNEYQAVPYDLSGENVLKMWGTGSAYEAYYKTVEELTSGTEIRFDFQRSGVTNNWHIAAVENNHSYNRWCIKEDDSENIEVQYRVNEGSWVTPKTLIFGAETGVWYTGLLRIWDGTGGFFIKVWKKGDPSVYNEYSYEMPTGKNWRFHSWAYSTVAGYHDNYRVHKYTFPEPTTDVGAEEAL